MFQILVLLLCAGQVLGDAEVDKWFEVSAIVPDILDKAPEEFLKVSYSGKDMDLGDMMTTLIMVDPDATSRRNPKMREWRHWMVINTKTETPSTLIQKGKFNPRDFKSINNCNRANFHTQEFIKKHKFYRDHPCNGNYFRVEAEA